MIFQHPPYSPEPSPRDFHIFDVKRQAVWVGCKSTERFFYGLKMDFNYVDVSAYLQPLLEHHHFNLESHRSYIKKYNFHFPPYFFLYSIRYGTITFTFSFFEYIKYDGSQLLLCTKNVTLSTTMFGKKEMDTNILWVKLLWDRKGLFTKCDKLYGY